jgi:hypothetical protein
MGSTTHPAELKFVAMYGTKRFKDTTTDQDHTPEE